jgi:hypothetical protein
LAGGWCWFVMREKYCWLVAGGWFVLREKYCWLVADKPSEQSANHKTYQLIKESFQLIHFMMTKQVIQEYSQNSTH